MATATRLPTDAPTDRLPADLPDIPAAWRSITDRDRLDYAERIAWVHEATGLRVHVRARRRPTQMHSPSTADDDIGFVARVQGDCVANLSYDVTTKDAAYERAIRFMAAFPGGDFEVPDLNGTGRGRVEW